MFFVILGWVLFRADSITAAGQYIGNMFGAGATGFIDATFIDCVKNSAVIFAAAVIFSFPVVSKVGELLEKKPMFKKCTCLSVYGCCVHCLNSYMYKGNI
jgi:D-alanyl-lipoteichoic acid acyltransferase DltB (MBOAT superfamily)